MSTLEQALHQPGPTPRQSLSVVIPCYNEEACLDACLDRLVPVLDATGLRWEIILVDDGSTDGTAPRARQRIQAEPRVRMVRLARNFGKEAALTCGLDHAQGDAVIPFDADLQDPPELITELVAQWRQGYEVVNAVRSDRSSDGWLKRSTARAFYALMTRGLKVRLSRDVGDFRLLDRRVLAVIGALRERSRFMKGIFAWPGFRTAEVPYVRAARAAGSTTWNWWKLWNFALDGIFSFSTAPLKIWFYFGCLVSLCSFAFALVVIVRKLFFSEPVHGYPSLMVAVLFLGGVQLMSLGIIGEYLGRIFGEVKGRPLYVIGEALGGGLDRPAGSGTGT